MTEDGTNMLEDKYQFGKRSRELMSREVTDMGTGAKLNVEPTAVTAENSMQPEPTMTIGPSTS